MDGMQINKARDSEVGWRHIKVHVPFWGRRKKKAESYLTCCCQTT